MSMNSEGGISKSASLSSRIDKLTGAGQSDCEGIDDQEQVEIALGDIQVGGSAASLSRRSDSGRYTPDGV
jgi:hypothetical protein